MELKTRVCDLLGIKYPVLQGAMAWIAGGELAGAVSAAGGCGFIGAGTAEPAWLEHQIELARARTDQPFGINLVLTSPYVEPMIDLVIEKKVSVVSTGAGNPGPYMERLKAAGIKVLPVVSSVALARRLQRLGADAVIAEGMESGGHIGEMTTMCLVPMMVDALNIPVIAAGGIADGRGLVAALALGAEAVQMGTVFICAPECLAHPAYQEKVIKARDRDTLICGQTTGHPVRAIHNRFAREYLAAERQGMSREELEALGAGRYPRAALQGEVENGTLLAGQICGLVNQVQTAAEIVHRVIGEADDLLTRWRKGEVWPE